MVKLDTISRPEIYLSAKHHCKADFSRMCTSTPARFFCVCIARYATLYVTPVVVKTEFRHLPRHRKSTWMLCSISNLSNTTGSAVSNPSDGQQARSIIWNANFQRPCFGNVSAQFCLNLKRCFNIKFSSTWGFTLSCHYFSVILSKNWRDSAQDGGNDVMIICKQSAILVPVAS